MKVCFQSSSNSVMSQEAKDVIQEEEAVVEGETGTKDEDSAAMPPPAEKAIEIEKMEEQKLKSKFPGELLFSFTTRPASLNLFKYFFQFSAIGGRPGGGGQSAFLQKRLGKGQKYFDSGDYQMAKQGGRMGRGKTRPCKIAGLVTLFFQPGPFPCWPSPLERSTPPLTVCRPGRAPSSRVSPHTDLFQSPHELFAGTQHPPGAPVGHPVGQPLPNPAMARLL